MIIRTFLDAAGGVLLDLYRLTPEQALLVKSETLPGLTPIGAFEEIPGTGLKVFVGERRPRAGQLEITLTTAGRRHEDAFALQRELLRIVPDIRAYSRVPGGTMDIAGASQVTRTITGSAQVAGAVAMTLECASPYFWADREPVTVPTGTPQPVDVGGVADTGLRVTITAGGSAVTDPSIRTDAGLTTWRGVIPAGGSLVLDSLNGWSVTLGGVDVDLFVTGPAPALTPGERTVTVTAPGAVATLQWREGDL